MTKNKYFKWLEAHEFWLVLLILVIFLRAPNLFEPYWYGDEGIYLTVGQGMRRGLKLYAEIIDHKTPIIYWMATLAPTLLQFKLLLVSVSLLSITLFYNIARRIFDDRLAVKVSTTVFALLTTLPWLEGNIANGEILLMPFILAGVWLFWQYFPKKIRGQKDLLSFYKKSSWWLPFLVGVFFSLALLLKVPAGFDFGALMVFGFLYVPFAWRRGAILPHIKFGLWLILGFATPILLSILYFAWRGTLDAYFDFGLLYNFRYIA